MKKTLKWSLLLTIVIAIIWLVIPGGLSKMSSVITFPFLGSNLSLSINDSILRLWDITVIVPSLLLISFVLKEDSDFNAGVIACSVSTVVGTLCSIDSITIKFSIFIFGIFGILIYFMNLAEDARSGQKKYVTMIRRSLASVFTVLLVNTLVFGLLNGVMVAVIFIYIYVIYGIITVLAIFLWKIGKALPKNVKLFFKWMNA